MKPSINSIEVKALQKLVSEWENNKLKDANDAVTSTATDGKITSSVTTASGGTFKEAKFLNTDNSGVVNIKIKTPMPPQIPASLNEEVSDATPITTGYDKAKLDLSGVTPIKALSGEIRVVGEAKDMHVKLSGATTVTTSGALPPAESGAMETKYTGSIYATSPYNGSTDELIQATTSWNTSASDFALNTTDMANNTTDCVTLFTANNDALTFANQTPSISLCIIQ